MIPIQTCVPVRYPPIANYALIGLNGAVFLFQISLPAAEQEAFVYSFGLVPARFTHPEWALRVGLDPRSYLPFVTTMFLHGGWLHLILNMWSLWLFGGAVEDRLGSVRYLLFYVACGLFAGLAHAAANAESTVPAVGASGAIAGVMGAYMRLFPYSRIVLLVPILFLPLFFALPAALYVAIWFILQVVQGTLATLQPQAGGVAWWAHIGGFVAGLVIVPLLHRPRRDYRPHYRDEGILGFRPREGR
ncbi:MAG: rhomboid family intramembrane serine protease [Variibacter sp.]|nr:rhomboid family intramembrane serine protease [Variibacter sp.]